MTVIEIVKNKTVTMPPFYICEKLWHPSNRLSCYQMKAVADENALDALLKQKHKYILNLDLFIVHKKNLIDLIKKKNIWR